MLLVVGAALLGAVLSPIVERLIARLLPRLGEVPRLQARISTAAVTAIACAAFAARFGSGLSLPAFILLAVLGAQLARIDIALHLLPNPLVIMLFAGGLLLLLLPGIYDKQSDDLLRGALGAVILFSGYVFLGLISPGAIGMGDVKLAGPVGLYLGYLGWSHLLYGGLLGFVLNGIVSMLMISRKGRNEAAEVPHGPSMLGALAAVTLFAA
ncbi:prepilin peptidase [Pseudarthrobacter niigatensis]|uniref:Leader peptidase (Prepilin peptidase)/N-methyltransferase n=1 Tax=Pseudarthrobacter niigatensis TaxID=369935 RepID=A0AAJ1WHN7_9MICC|nr:prepilin peptidase [Pseudarthrobacter niigatensis]MDQ0147990.1 leader peptidase (prepilin peptidase)/N-methyltransferase [Pseudarthrobacter niigatensis]MDQ0264173.1 leader peptidase (prepilin peptidase)/N-methyltransferase [Pseudarthrobacter niigatensis]